jgi:hypothetical protein
MIKLFSQHFKKYYEFKELYLIKITYQNKIYTPDELIYYIL